VKTLTARTLFRPASRLMAALMVALILPACTSLNDGLKGDKIDYKSATRAPSLDIPPDLTQLSPESNYVIPGTAVTASGQMLAQATSPSIQTAANSVGDVRIERAGNQRWLVVNRPAEKLWEPIREFWQENGFLLATDQQTLGIMETDYAENRAKIPQDVIRATIGKVFDSLYSTGERDKFRTRLERTGTGGTEIYISHRGMVEVIVKGTSGASEKGGSGTVWQPRPADPELEAEFLRRLMVKLGVSQEQSKALVASGVIQKTSRVASINNVPVVEIDDGFDRAWRRVGLTLDRTGFSVEDRDRTQGIYFVRYVEPVGDKKEPGFFSKLFSGSTAAAGPLKYQIVVRSQGQASLVSVLDAQGNPEKSANAQSIVQVIADDLQ
jgi:outer membrane protein assembly factor BamC